MVLQKLSLKIINLLILLSVARSFCSHAHGFGQISLPYTEKIIHFNKTIRMYECHGELKYPYFHYNNEEGSLMKINEEIYDFISLRAFCNPHNNNDKYIINYDIPPSDSTKYFSIRLLTYKNNKLWRIDSITFNLQTGDIIDAKKVFNLYSINMIEEMIKISDGHLSKYCNWEQFLDKIQEKEIQYYIKNKEWYIIFNSTPTINGVSESKIPNYFLQDNE